MAVLTTFRVGRNIIFSNPVLFNFQGRYVNRYFEDNVDCHCYPNKGQKRNFISFSKEARTKEYCGRQLVGYTMEQMFEVVSDVGNYNKFLPWCKKSIVLERKPGNLKADLIIGFPPINESYTSNVTLIHPHVVKAVCTDGRIFEHMLTVWRFSPGLKSNPQSCVIDFQITFAFRSALHSQLSKLFFDQVARQMESAFIREVGQRYGPATIQPRNLLLNNAKS